jgi:hypothetical protein
MCTVGARCYAVCAGSRATCGRGGGGHAACVLEVVKVEFHAVELAHDIDLCWIGGGEGLRTFAGRGRCCAMCSGRGGGVRCRRQNAIRQSPVVTAGKHQKLKCHVVVGPDLVGVCGGPRGPVPAYKCYRRL